MTTIHDLGWSRDRALAVRGLFGSIVEDWDDPSMDIYDNVKPDGLYSKYTVIDNETGEEIKDFCFVLVPGKDHHAYKSLDFYAREVFVDNLQLSEQLLEQLGQAKEDLRILAGSIFHEDMDRAIDIFEATK